jgi:hypothetical protein
VFHERRKRERGAKLVCVGCTPSLSLSFHSPFYFCEVLVLGVWCMEISIFYGTC